MPEWERGRENFLEKHRDKVSKTVYQQRNGNHTYFWRLDFGEQTFICVIGF